MFRILSMFGPLSGAKFWVAVVMAVAQFINVYAGIDLGLDEQTLTAIIGGLGALLVWLVPNAKPQPSIPVLTEAEARARAGGYSGPIETRNR